MHAPAEQGVKSQKIRLSDNGTPKSCTLRPRRALNPSNFGSPTDAEQQYGQIAPLRGRRSGIGARPAEVERVAQRRLVFVSGDMEN